MDYTYQQLTPVDIGIFKQTLKMFGEAFEDKLSYQSNIPSDAYIARMLAKQDFIALVARKGGTVVGALAAYVLEKFEQQRSEVYIYDLAVDSDHRRQGIATQLINALKPIAKSKGGYVIFVQADQVDKPAIRLYESLGKREDVYHFDIPVE